MMILETYMHKSVPTVILFYMSKMYITHILYKIIAWK